MNYTRIYNDDDGTSRFADGEVSFLLTEAFLLPVFWMAPPSQLHRLAAAPQKEHSGATR